MFIYFVLGLLLDFAFFDVSFFDAGHFFTRAACFGRRVIGGPSESRQAAADSIVTISEVARRCAGSQNSYQSATAGLFRQH